MDNLFAAGDINSVDYWNQRFFADWIAEGGRAQTAFFAQLCVRELPDWCRDDIAARRLSIFDYGCALGDALPVFEAAFPRSPIRGGDVAEAGLGLARALHPGFAFERVGAGGEPATLADVVYCSNTLEHFESWQEILQDLGRRAGEYLVVLVPFEEDDRIVEHLATFEFDSLPVRLASGLRLLQLSVVNTAALPQTYWNGQQLIAIYGGTKCGEAAPVDICQRRENALYLDLRDLKHAAATALLAAVAALSRERRLAARQAVAATAAQAEASAERADAAIAEAEAQRRLAEELAQQRDAAQLAAAEAVHAELAKLRTEHAAAEQRLRARIGQLETAERETLPRLVRDFADRVRSTAETEAGLRDRLKELAGELAAATIRLQEGAGLARLTVVPIRRQLAFAARHAGRRAAAARQWGAAARHYRRALQWAPALPKVWVQLGHALKELGDRTGAEDAYTRALALDPSAADTHVQLARLFRLEQRWDEAARCYDRALQLEPKQEEASRQLDELAEHLTAAGNSARDRRDWAAAARHYRQALARRPGMTAIWVQLGHALKERGEHAEAEAAYRRALALDDRLADSHLQLGHLFKLTGRRGEAVAAYAAALRRDPDFAAAREALDAALGYPASAAELAALLDPSTSTVLGAFEGGGAAGGVAPSPAERYGALFPDAARQTGGGRDVIWLGVIDWNFRIQRPQHLACRLADGGARVFYVSLLFEEADVRGRFRIIDAPHEGVFETRLRLCGDPGESIYRGLGRAAVGELQLALDELIAAAGLSAPVVIVEHPAWREVACGVAGATVVYDCLDLASGFSNAAAGLPAAEAALLAEADVVVAASQPLFEHVARRRPAILVRNAADFDFFAAAASERPVGARPVVGYFGAIAEWFEIDWIAQCAGARPDWEFRLIGRTDGCDIAHAAALPNVHFLGEKPYRELPALLAKFNVALIPFRMVELTRCTNPVKLYEYMAAGKPVVAAPLPEVVEASDLVYIAADAGEFESRIAQALDDDNPGLRTRRQEWARQHSWASRAGQLEGAIAGADPLVSVVVLTHNHWDYTRSCLASLRRWSDYPNLEIIAVDNGSSDETPERLRELSARDKRVRVILNEANLGFPAGNNVGLRAATGEYLILLNNDTVVTRGWVRDLIRPMQRDARVGLTGPLTNKIGNEQKARAGYRTLTEMPEWARRFARERLRRTVETTNLAFFCVALRRRVVEEIGLLDEAYGVGFFEDDDYCRRALQAGWKLLIADDVFVHHHLSVSFDALGGRAAEVMAKNRVLFEERWGAWQPHRYREEPGFG